LDNLFSVGEATGNRRQINVKIDQNFSAKHKVNLSVSYERVDSDDLVMGWPNTFSDLQFHRPLVLTAGFTSTLSATVVNEARFGMRRSGTNVVAPWDHSEYDTAINKFLPPETNGFKVLPYIEGTLGFCTPITGARPPNGCLL